MMRQRYGRKTPPKDPEHILIIRLSAIGDVVMASGMIRALRHRYPRAYLAWLAEPVAAPLLAANSELDDVLIWPKSEWRTDLRAGRWFSLAGKCRALIRTIRRNRFDTVLDAQGLLKSGIWAWVSGAPVRLGLGAREGSRFLMTGVIGRPANDARFGSEYIDAAMALGASSEDFVPRVAVDDDSRASAEQSLVNAIGDRPFVALAPFTTRPQKHWFERYWCELIIRLAADYGASIVILGGPADAEKAQVMIAAVDSADTPPVISLAGQTSLRETMAVVERARLIVGVDTGVTHMGTAAKRPTVALFGSTCPYTAPGVSTTTVLFASLACAPCHKNPTCGGRFTCMAELTTEKVLHAAREQLGEYRL